MGSRAAYKQKRLEHSTSRRTELTRGEHRIVPRHRGHLVRDACRSPPQDDDRPEDPLPPQREGRAPMEASHGGPRTLAAAGPGCARQGSEGSRGLGCVWVWLWVLVLRVGVVVCLRFGACVGSCVACGFGCVGQVPPKTMSRFDVQSPLGLHLWPAPLLVEEEPASRSCALARVGLSSTRSQAWVLAIRGRGCFTGLD